MWPPQGKRTKKDEFDAVGMQGDWELPMARVTSVPKSRSNAVVPQQVRPDPNSPVSPEQWPKVFVLVAWLRTNLFLYFSASGNLVMPASGLPDVEQWWLASLSSVW